MITVRHILNLIENLQLGLYNSDRFAIQCQNDFVCKLTLQCNDSNISIELFLNSIKKHWFQKRKYIVTVVCGGVNYDKEKTFNLSKRQYDYITSYIKTWAITKDTNNEAVVIDTFGLNVLENLCEY